MASAAACQIVLVNSRLLARRFTTVGSALAEAWRPLPGICLRRQVAPRASSSSIVRADPTTRFPVYLRPADSDYQHLPESRAEDFVPSGAAVPGLPRNPHTVDGP